MDINKIVVSDKVSFGKKGFRYFTDYKDAKKLDLQATCTWNFIQRQWPHLGFR